MFSRSVNDDSRSIIVYRMIVSDATTWSVTYTLHSDDHNIFIIEAAVPTSLWFISPSSLLAKNSRLNVAIPGKSAATSVS